VGKHRLLYLPLETKARELLGKSFLAARAVDRGWIVVFGAHNEMQEFMLEHPMGAYIEISLPQSKAVRLEKLKKAGYRIFNLCEESVNYLSGRFYCFQMLSLDTLPWVEKLFALGSVNAEHIRTYQPQFTEKVAITGNPKFDTLLPELRVVYEARAEVIRKRYGRFLLINTNFGLTNYLKIRDGEDIPAVYKRRGMILNQEHEESLNRQVDYEGRKARGLRTLLSRLGGSGVVDQIVLRPHPAENHDAVRQWAAPLNIEVVYEGSANEWMLAAEAVLHPGCTTGLEGLLLDRPVFSYVPEESSEFETLSDRLSRRVTSCEELIAAVSEIRDMGLEEIRNRFARQRSELGPVIANTDLPFAADRILDELEDLDLPAVTPWQVGASNWAAISKIRVKMRKRSEPAARRVSARNLQKLPGIAPSELRTPIRLWMNEGLLTKTPRITLLSDRMCVWH
jgi:surface carbohydrate biosynthesis protein